MYLFVNCESLKVCSIKKDKILVFEILFWLCYDFVVCGYCGM